MTARAFVDTNVVVYLFDAADPSKRAAAQEVFADAGLELVLSTQVLAEAYVVLTRKLATPLDEGAAAALIDTLTELQVVATDAPLVRDAVATSRRHQLSLWDALIVEAASSAAVDVLLTEDLADGTTLRGVPIQNPFG